MTRRLPAIFALTLTVIGLPGSRARLGLIGPAPLAAQHSTPTPHPQAVPLVPPVPPVPPVQGVSPDVDVNIDIDNGDPDVRVRRGPDAALRTITTGRQFRAGRDTASALHLDVTYGSGALAIAPADPSWLYNVSLENPVSAQSQPLIAFDTISRVLRINSGRGDRVNVQFPRRPHDSETSDLHIRLARGVPLDIGLAFGAGEGNVQLGGLSVRQLKIESGASQTSIGFNAPNPIPLETFSIEVGAAEFNATGLGNANIRHMTVQAGAGSVDLNFGGTWTSDVSLDVTAALGEVKIHVPRDIVIDRNNKVFLGAIEDNTEGVLPPTRPGAPVYHLHLSGTTTLGAIELDRHTGS